MLKIPAKIPFNPAKIPFFYGWAILFAGAVGVVMSIPGQTMGISVFTDHLISDLSIDRVSLSFAYLLGTAASGLLITYAGILYDRLGARIIAIAAGIFLGIMLVYLTRIDVFASYLTEQFSILSLENTIFVLLSLGFFGVRFFGQGVLTMTSRNMVMKWFDKRRGFANAILGIITSFSFSYSPRLIKQLIDLSGWKNTWITMAMASGIFFILFVFIFFRDNPEDAGLIPDGTRKIRSKSRIKSSPDKQYTLKEAISTFSFWIFSLTLTMNALYITAYTFHVTSIFNHSGFSNDQAVALFLPISFVAVTITFFGSWASDYMKLKGLLILNTLGLLLSMVGLVFLKEPYGIPLVVAGSGISNGMFGILMAVTWPRFFGTKHLGSISGLALSLSVIGSAIGPYLFSISERHTRNYTSSTLILIGISFVLLLLAFKADNVNDGNKTTVSDEPTIKK